MPHPRDFYNILIGRRILDTALCQFWSDPLVTRRTAPLTSLDTYHILSSRQIIDTAVSKLWLT